MCEINDGREKKDFKKKRFLAQNVKEKLKMLKYGILKKESAKRGSKICTGV